MDAVTNTRMSVTAFGEALIRTRDLDPVYVALYGARLPRDQLCRLLLAYLCFYHLGVAAWLSEWEEDGYWLWMTVAAENKVGPREAQGKVLSALRWPRAAERRHFRGQKCVDAVRWLAREFGRPEAPVEHLTLTNLPGSEGGLTEKVVMERVEAWPMFGPWVAFKAADMLERIMGVPVQFDRELGLMYEEPRKGLDLLAAEGDPGVPPTPGVQPAQKWWHSYLLDQFSKFPAPPAGDRPCGPQETESVLCKWKSYMNGHYWVGKDIHEVRTALIGWGETASRLLTYMPEEVSR